MRHWNDLWDEAAKNDPKLAVQKALHVLEVRIPSLTRHPGDHCNLLTEIIFKEIADAGFEVRKRRAERPSPEMTAVTIALSDVRDKVQQVPGCEEFWRLPFNADDPS